MTDRVAGRMRGAGGGDAGSTDANRQFALAGRADGLWMAMPLLVSWSAVVGLLAFMLVGVAVSGASIRALWITALGSGLAFLAVCSVFASSRARTARVEISDDAIIIRGVGWPNLTVPLEHALSAGEYRPRFRNFFRLHPWGETLTVLPIMWMNERGVVRLELSRGVGQRWWPLARYRTIFIDPEDRAGFIAALHRVAPHVTIEPSVLEQ